MVDGSRRGLPSELAAAYAQRTPQVREDAHQGFSLMGQQRKPSTFRALGEESAPGSNGGFRTLTPGTVREVTAKPLQERRKRELPQDERQGNPAEAMIQEGAIVPPRVPSPPGSNNDLEQPGILWTRKPDSQKIEHPQVTPGRDSEGEEVQVSVYPTIIGEESDGDIQESRWEHTGTSWQRRLQEEAGRAASSFHPAPTQGIEQARETRQEEDHPSGSIGRHSRIAETLVPGIITTDELVLKEAGEMTLVRASHSDDRTPDNAAVEDPGRGGGDGRGTGGGSTDFPDEPVPEGKDGDGDIAVTLTREIKSLIQNRELAPGTQLLFAQTLANEVGTSRAQTLLVYRALEAEGLIERRSRVGYFVREKPPAGNNNVTRITKRLGTQIQKGDISPETKLLSYKELAELEDTDSDTARVSYIILESNGLIETKRSEGHFVRADRDEPPQEVTLRLLQGINLIARERPVLVPSVPVFRPNDEIPVPDPTIENSADQIRDLIRRGYRDTPIAAVLGCSQANVNIHRMKLSSAGENIPTQQRITAEMHQLVLEGIHTDDEIAQALGYSIKTVIAASRKIDEVPVPYEEVESVDLLRTEKESGALKEMSGKADAGELPPHSALAAFPDMQRIGILVTELLESATGLVSTSKGSIGNLIDISRIAAAAELDTQTFIEFMAGTKYIDPNRVYKPLRPYFDEQAAQMQEIGRVTRSYNLLRTLSQDGLTTARAMEYLRLELNIGQDEFAPLLNMTRSNYVKFAQGQTVPLVKTLDSILEACNVDPHSREGQMFHLVRAGVKPMSSEEFTQASDAERIRYARTAFGHYIKDFAAKLYIYELTLINYEGGKRPIPEDIRRELTGIIGVRPDSPLGRVIIHPEKLEFSYEVDDFLTSPLLLQEHIPGEDKPYWLSQKEEKVYRQMQRSPRLSRIVELLIDNFNVHQKKLNQKELAAAANVHPNTISHILDNRPPRDFILTRIFSAYGYDVFHPFTQHALQCLEEAKRRDSDT
jgi:DNA-binding transcriptional regulator YhcF (GntR family)/transcriptional regulator with XRE-family HTH domain